jgi:uncharacterized protein (TIGR03435 family)
MMTESVVRRTCIRKIPLPAFVGILTAAVLIVPCTTNLRAQTVADKTPLASSSMPQWQKAAGGKMEFEVASVRESTPDAPWRDTNDMMPFGGNPPQGSLFSANVPLYNYIIFAYRIFSMNQLVPLRAKLPDWANSTPFDIKARSESTPTRDQLRLMVQSLLEERFKLAMHTETRQGPVYALVLDKPGKLGPNLRQHPDNVPCANKTDTMPTDTVAAAHPVFCGIDGWRTESGQMHTRAVNVTMEEAAGFLSVMPGLEPVAMQDSRPIIDQTGLSGRFDIDLEFTPEVNGPSPDSQSDAGGTTAPGALKNQLGLKLVKQTGPVSVLVIDHVEKPSAN